MSPEFFQIGIKNHGQVSNEDLAHWHHRPAILRAMEESITTQRLELLRFTMKIFVKLDAETPFQIPKAMREIAHKLLDNPTPDQVILRHHGAGTRG